jgi:hypothetical protein
MNTLFSSPYKDTTRNDRLFISALAERDEVLTLTEYILGTSGPF